MSISLPITMVTLLTSSSLVSPVTFFRPLSGPFPFCQITSPFIPPYVHPIKLGPPSLPRLYETFAQLTSLPSLLTFLPPTSSKILPLLSTHTFSSLILLSLLCSTNMLHLKLYHVLHAPTNPSLLLRSSLTRPNDLNLKRSTVDPNYPLTSSTSKNKLVLFLNSLLLLDASTFETLLQRTRTILAAFGLL